MKSLTIKINGIDYTVKPTFRSMLEFESFTGKSIDNIKGLNSMTEFLYCSLKVNNRKEPVFSLSYDDFLDSIDENLDIINQVGDLFEVKENTEEEKNV